MIWNQSEPSDVTKVNKPQKTKRWRERGNVFFTLFGAVAVVGVLGAGIMATMRGPLSTMVEVNRIEQAKAEMRVGMRLILLGSTDQDADALTEPVDPSTCTGSPTNGGCIPNSVSANKTDPWGTSYGYCAWNVGDTSTAINTNTLAGGTSTNNITVAVISAGPDRTFQTGCAADPTYVGPDPSGDDLLQFTTYTDAVEDSGGLWVEGSGGTTAEITKDLQVTGGATFTDDINLTNASAQLQLGAASMLLPTDSVLATCNLANDLLLRVNDATFPSLEICDGTNSQWLTAASNWTLTSGGDIYNANSAQVGIGNTSPDDALDVTGNVGVTGNIELGGNLEMVSAASVIWNSGSGGTITGNSTTLQLDGNGSDTEVTIGTDSVDIAADVTITGTSTSSSDYALDVLDSSSGVLMRIMNNGQVGIGDSNPDDSLEVGGFIDASDAYKINNNIVLHAPDTTNDFSILLGYLAGGNPTNTVTGDNNTILGASTANTLTTGTDNILIGYQADTPSASTSNYLNIGDLIFGDLTNNRIGIGTDTLNDALEVAGNIDATGTITSSSTISGTSLAATSGTVTATGNITSSAGNVRGINITATGSGLNGNVTAQRQFIIGSTQFGPVPVTCSAFEKLEYDGGWSCETIDLSGGGTGDTWTIEDILTNGNDANDKNLDDLNKLGLDELCDPGLTTNCSTPTQIAGAIAAVNAGTGGLWTEGTGSEIYYNTSNANVGIGINDPAEQLHVLDTSTSDVYQLRLERDDATSSYMQLGADGNGLGYITAAGLSLTTSANGEAIRIDNATGKVGIGSNAPSARFDIRDSGNQLRLIDSDDSKDAQFSLDSGDLSIVMNAGSDLKLTETGKLLLNSPSASTGTGLNGQALIVDIGGAVGATYFCTEDGEECFTATDMWTNAMNVPSAVQDTDEDTKIQVEESDDEDKIRFDTAGSERMIIDETGNVGIGTNAPSQKLHVYEDVNSALRIRVHNPNAAGTSANAQFRAVGDVSSVSMLSHGSARTLSRYGETLGGWSEIIQSGASSNGLAFGTSGSNPLILGTASTLALYIDASQNVGIGTNAPSQALHVIGNIQASGNLSFNSASASGNIGAVLYCDENGANCFSSTDVGSVDTFLELTDTPSSYTADYFISVNSGGTALEFINPDSNSTRSALGLAIGTDVQAYDADLDVYAANGLTAAEIQQLQNIDTTTISGTQWGYLGALNQALSTTDDVTFNSLSATANIGAAQFCNASGGECFTPSQLTGLLGGNLDWNSLADAMTLDASTNVTTGAFDFSFNGGSSLFIQGSTNRIGVGTNSPQATAHFVNTASGVDSFRVDDQASDTTYFVIDEDGNTGIGTTTPIGPFHVGGAANKSIAVDSASNRSYFGAFNDFTMVGVNRNPATGSVFNTGKAASNIALEGINGNSSIRFETTITNNTAPTERMRIDGSGNVGVGDTTPDAHFEISANGTTGGNVLLVSSDDANDGDLFTVTETGQLTFNSASASGNIGAVLYCDENGANCFDPANVGSIDTFLELTDTPSAFTSSGGFFVSVNSGATALEFIDPDTNTTRAALGLAIGTDVQAYDAQLDALSAFTAAEVSQLANIDTTTISATQWGYLGALDQGLTTTSDVTFNSLSATSNVGAVQYCDENGANCFIPSNVAAISTGEIDWDDITDTMTLDASTSILAPNGQAYVLSITNDGTGDSFVVNDVASDTTPFVIAADGDVGIGDPTPDSRLDLGTVNGASSEVGLTISSPSTEFAITSYAGGTDNLRIRNETADSDLMVIQSDGDIAIGSTVVSGSLQVDVTGDVGATQYCDENGANCLDASSVTTTQWGYVGNLDQDLITTSDVTFNSLSATANIGATKFCNASGGECFTPSQLTGLLGGNLDWNSLADAMTLDASTNVTTGAFDFSFNGGSSLFIQGSTNRIGVGTSSPQATAHFVNTASGVDSFRVDDQASDTTYFVIDENGNTGIGETAPDSLLHIKGAVEQILTIESGTTGAMHFFEGTSRRGILGYSSGTSIASNATDNDMVLRTESGSNLHLAISNQARLTIDSSGNVGIGDIGPDAHLEISVDGGTGGDAFYISSDDGNDGDLFTVTEAGQLTFNSASASGNIGATQFCDENGANCFAAASVGSVDTFLELTDTPSAFTSSGGFFVSVNSGATALEFIDPDTNTTRAALGLAIGTDVQAYDADLDVLAANGLTAAEFQQLQNINTTTISATQWGYLGALDQALATTDSVTFNGISASAISATGNIDAATFTGDGSALTGVVASDYTADSIDWDDIDDTMILDATTTIDMTAGDLNFDSNTFVIDSSANEVGIGTNNPTSKLGVATSVTNDGLSVTDGTVRTILYSTGSNRASLWTTTNHPLTFGTNNGEKARIEADGSFGIGDVSPEANFELSVNGDTGGDAFYISSDDGNDGDLFTVSEAGLLTFNSASASAISATGNIDAATFTGDGSGLTGVTAGSVDWANITSRPQTVLDIAGLTPTDSSIIVGDGSNFVSESGATARTSLGLAIGTDVQAYDAQLDALSAFTAAEVSQLANIDTTTISATQWGYLGALDQALSTTDDVAFNSVSATFSGDGSALTGVTASDFSADSIDWDDISDTMTLDATTTIDMTAGDLNFDSDTFFIDSSTNRIGIGTASPTQDLHLYGSGDKRLLIESTDNNPVLELQTATQDSFIFVDRTDGDLQIYTGTGGEDVILQQSGGNVGIKNSTPAEALDVTGNALFSGTVGVGDASPDAHLEVSANGTTGGNAFLVSSDDGNDGDLFTVTEAGQLTFNSASASGNIGAAQYCDASGLNCFSAGTVGTLDTFLELTDTPSAFTSSGGFFVSVNSGATALEFINPDSNSTRSALGLAIGTDVQAWDDDLDDIAALTPTDSFFIVGDGSNFTTESEADARSSLGLAIGSDVQAYDADLDVYAANGLLAAEIQQLQNINTTTISATQWGYLGALDQGLASTDSVTFNALSVTNNASVGGDLDVTGNISAATFTGGTFTGDGSALTGVTASDFSADSIDWDDISDNMTMDATTQIELGSNDFAISANSYSSFVIDASSGNVGIGSSTPATSFEVKAPSGAGSFFRITKNDGTQVLNVTNGGSLQVTSAINAPDNTSSISLAGGSAVNQGGNIILYGPSHAQAGDIIIRSQTTENFRFDAAAGDFYVLNGDVGFGENNPDAHLEVSANGTTGGNAFLVSSDDDNDGDLFTVTEAGQLTFNSASASGNIGAAQYCDASGLNCFTAASVGSASAFTDLTDTPSAFTSSGGFFVSVNSGATALEFIDPDTNTTRAALGLAIGTDVQAYDADLDVYAANGLTATEIQQLQNIDTTTISATQFGYLGALDQGLTTTSDVTFNSLSATANIGAAQYCDASGLNCFTASDMSSGGNGAFIETSNVILQNSPGFDEDFVFGSTQLADTTNSLHDNRMFFDKSKGAFRAGEVSGTQWDDGSVGAHSTALGRNTTASGSESFATGLATTASGTASASFGNSTRAEGSNSFAIGVTSEASGFSSFAVGREVVAGNGTGQGVDTNTDVGNYSVAFGLGDSTGGSSTYPRVTANESFGIFFGDQQSSDLDLENTFGLIGGKLLIDTVDGGSDTDRGCIQYNDTSNQLEFSDDCSTYTAFNALSSIPADSIDWDDITDTMTLDATTTIDMDTNTADINFDSNTFVIDSSTDRVGIGSNSPDAALDIEDISGNQLRLTANGSNYMTLNNAGNFDVVNVTPSNRNYTFSLQGSEYVRIDSAGDVGIGFNDPSQGKLDVNGGIYTNAGIGIGKAPASTGLTILGGNILIREDDDGNDGIVLQTDNNNSYLDLKSVGTTVIRLDSTSAGASYINNGNFAIGDTATSTGEQTLKLDVTGYVGATGFCDADGNSCFNAASVGTGGVSEINDLSDAFYSDSTNSLYLGEFAGTAGSFNTGVGYSALASIGASSDNNTALGFNAGAGLSATGDDDNVAIGHDAMEVSGGNDNVAIGYQAMANTSGAGTNINNVAIGSGALLANLGGGVNNNVAVGFQAGIGMISGDDNVLLGYQAGNSLTTGSDNILIGYDVDASGSTASNELNIGNVLYGDLTNSEIGIGVASPSAMLHVDKDTTGTALLVQGGNTGNVLARFQRDVGDAGIIDIFSAGGDPQIRYDVEAGGTVWLTGVDDGNGDAFTIATGTNITNGTARMVVDAAGDVGIGFNDPSNTKLGVAGTVGATSYCDTDGANCIVPGSITATDYTADSIDWDDITDTMTLDATTTIDMDTNTADINFDSDTFVIDSSADRVGIGTSSPASELHLYDDGGAATSMRIESVGGTTQLFSITADEGENYIHFDVGGTGHSGDRFHFGDLSANANDITTFGNVGIGFNDPSVGKLDVAGDIYTTGNVQYAGGLIDTSDRRLKTDIQPLDANSMRAKIRDIDTYRFRMKDNPNGPLEFGVMAQELEGIFPELVFTAEDEMGTKSVAYLGLIAPMIEAMQEMDSENAEMKNDIESMKADIAALKIHTGFGIKEASVMGLLMMILGAGLTMGFVVLRRKNIG